jgi:hypothetical protein
MRGEIGKAKVKVVSTDRIENGVAATIYNVTTAPFSASLSNPG